MPRWRWPLVFLVVFLYHYITHTHSIQISLSATTHALLHYL